jgi:hypothetical protein
MLQQSQATWLASPGPITSGPTKGRLARGSCRAPGNPDYDNILPLQAFIHMMWPAQLLLMLELTNVRLAAKEKQEMTCQELLRWICVCMLIASINF